VKGSAATTEKFVRLRRARRIWAVAAIHGEATRLTRLHDLIAARFADGDRLVYLGNYLGHGGAVAATIDELLDFRRQLLAHFTEHECTRQVREKRNRPGPGRASSGAVDQRPKDTLAPIRLDRGKSNCMSVNRLRRSSGTPIG